MSSEPGLPVTEPASPAARDPCGTDTLHDRHAAKPQSHLPLWEAQACPSPHTHLCASTSHQDSRLHPHVPQATRGGPCTPRPLPVSTSFHVS